MLCVYFDFEEFQLEELILTPHILYPGSQIPALDNSAWLVGISQLIFPWLQA